MPKDTLKIHSIETLGALDGPGLRTIFFLFGCPLRCLYCHNPDAIFGDSYKEAKIEQLVKVAVSNKAYFGEEGGVTISGGEPLFQIDGVLALIRALKKERIHTVLDTSGIPFSKEILDEVDMVLLDIKHTDSEQFFTLTKAKIDGTLKTLEYLKQIKKRFWVRQVIIDGFTNNEQQVKRLKEISLGAEKIELLAYHKMGLEKYKKLGLKYGLDDTSETSEEDIKRLNRVG